MEISLFESKLQAFERAIKKKGDFKSFGLKIISGQDFEDHLSTARFMASIYLECFIKCLFDPKKFKLKKTLKNCFYEKAQSFWINYTF